MIALAKKNHAVIHWTSMGFWSVMDQGLFALANFLLNILLARWLGPTEYGAFTVAYTLFLLIGTLHTGLFSDPMQVFGPGKHKKRFGSYLHVLLLGHLLFAFGISALLALAAVVFNDLFDNTVVSAVTGLAVASPFILLQWLGRRACYSALKPRIAAQAGIIYIVLMIPGLLAFYTFDYLDVLIALGIMSVASLVSGSWTFLKLGVDGKSRTYSDLILATLEDHWQYGRWAMATGILSWIPGNAVYFLLSTSSGLADAGALRALTNLVMPILQINAALSSILLPFLVQAKLIGKKKLIKLMRISTIILTGLALTYYVLITTFGKSLIEIFYGQAFITYSPVIWILGLQPISAAIIGSLGATMRALELPKQITKAYAVTSILTITVGSLLIFDAGIKGAIATLLLTSTVTALLLWVYLKKYLMIRTSAISI